MPSIQEDLQSAVAAHQSGRLEESNAIYENVLRIDPANVDALHLSGLVAHQRGNHREAITKMQRAIELQPNLPVVYNNLGAAQKSIYELEAATASYERAVELRPDYADAWNNLGIVLNELGDLDGAIAAYQRAIQVNQNFASAFHNLGIALKTTDRLDEAEAAYRRALEIAPHFAQAHNYLGNVLQEQGRFEEALLAYRRALELEPQNAEAHRHFALLLQLLGDFETGWDEYEWRWKCAGFPERHFPLPQWEGTSLAGKAILVTAEQGIGDEILFATCLPDLIDQAAHCIVECDARLLPLYRRSFANVDFLPRQLEDNADVQRLVEKIDFQIPIGSLPRAFRRSLDAFPVRSTLLRADESAAAKWRQRLEQLGPGLKVGISWRGGGTADVRRGKSTPLVQWQPILTIPKAAFINLQYGDCTAELRDLEQRDGIAIHAFPEIDPLIELDEFASLITGLDLVISVSNATVHVAGALGVPTWTMIRHAPQSRWLLNRDDSVWYPSLRLFRQKQPGEWQHVINEVANELARLASQSGDGEGQVCLDREVLG